MARKKRLATRGSWLRLAGSHISHTQYSYASTPKSEADACVSCDLPFDESEIAPELRKEDCSVDTPDSRRGKEEESPPLNCTNLEAVDISIDEGASRILSTPPQDSMGRQMYFYYLEWLFVYNQNKYGYM